MKLNSNEIVLVIEALNFTIVNADLSFVEVDTEGKTFEEIISELSSIWNTLSEENKIKVAQRAGGNHNIATFFALMDE